MIREAKARKTLSLELPQSLTHLGDSVARFLGSKQPSTIELQTSLIMPLGQLGEVCVIGGLVRDIAFYGMQERPISDVDLVVRAHPAAVARFASSLGATPNRFGGFGVRTTAFKADFWAFSTTWAKQAGHVALNRTRDLWKCTFFDWDAVAYSIGKSRVYAIPRFLERLQSRTLDINLRPNPSEKGNLIRALRRLVMWDVRPGPQLRHFIADTLLNYEWRELVEAEAKAFHVTFLTAFSSRDEYQDLVLKGGIFPGLGRDDRRQPPFEMIKRTARQTAPKARLHLLTRAAYVAPEKFDVPEMPTRTRDLFE